MTTLAHYTSPGLIVPQLRSQGTAAVIGELCSRLHGEGRVHDPLAFYNAVNSRELLSSTAMRPGLAVPHARLQGLPRLSFALGRSTTGLDWFGRRRQSIQLVFLFAVPESAGPEYLYLVSGVARLSKDLMQWESLLQAPDTQSIFEVLQQISVRPPRVAAAIS